MESGKPSLISPLKLAIEPEMCSDRKNGSGRAQFTILWEYQQYFRVQRLR
jgi:hypothetical protein